MAVQISKARLESDQSREISAFAYQPADHGPALCPDLRCLCKLRYVPAGSRQVKDKQVDIDPYFGLPSSASRKGSGHKPFCRYMIEPKLKKLVAQSHEITKLDPNAEPMLFGPQGLLAEFRLHILMKVLRGDGNVSDDEDEDGEAKKHRSATAYVPIDKLQHPYFRIAHGVLALIEGIRDHGFLEDFIRIKYADLSLAWEDYYFGPGELGRLHEYLLAHNQVIGGHNRIRPTATVVQIDRSKEPVVSQYGNWRVHCMMSKTRMSSGEEVVIYPNMYVDQERIAKRLAKWDHVLICALPTTEPLKKNPNPKYRRSAKINFSVFHREQICRFKPRDEI